MTDYYYDAQASGANDGTTKTDAFTTFAAALAAMAAGDRLLRNVTSVETVTGDTYLTLPDRSTILTINYTTNALAESDTTQYLGNPNSTLNLYLYGNNVYIHGMAFARGGNGGRSMWFNQKGGVCAFTLSSCKILNNSIYWDNIKFGGSSSSSCAQVLLIDCEVISNCSYNNWRIVCGAKVKLSNFKYTKIGSQTQPTALFGVGTDTLGGSTLEINNSDLSELTTNIVENSSGASLVATISNSKIGVGCSLLSSSGLNTRLAASAEVFAFNVSSADQRYHIAFQNAFGLLVCDTGISFNTVSWKIITTADATETFPFVTPFLDRWWTATSAITPTLEILRTDSTSALNNDDVWAEYSYQGTSGSPLGISVNNGKVLLESNAAIPTGAGTGAWTNPGGTAWSGKLVSPSITPLNPGTLRARVLVGKPLQTIYVNPSIDV